uniref:Integrase catalytic domain-containing protein n=1 Tax=Cannabis sativa TaxID=3483 RepID=A0A803NJ49_CANSA
MVLADQDECSPIPTSPESSVAQPRQRWVFCPSRGGATEVLRIQEKVTERRAVYHYDRCQVEVQFQVKASVFSSCCLLWSSSFLPSLFNEINSKIFSCFTQFMAFVENPFGMTLKIFQSDGGRESNNSSLRSLCDEKGIHPRFSCPNTPQQNGLVERKHRHISEMGRTLMIASSVPLIFGQKLFALLCF